MELKEIISVTGVSGLKKLIANRNDGLILADLNGENKKFFSSRTYMFSPLDNISIYTDEDMVTVAEVLWKMKEKSTETPVVGTGASNDELSAYFAIILPNYDREKVKVSDIKKLTKWYQVLNELDVIKNPEIKEEKEEA
jgi:hypothetical protein